MKKHLLTVLLSFIASFMLVFGQPLTALAQTMPEPPAPPTQPVPPVPPVPPTNPDPPPQPPTPPAQPTAPTIPTPPAVPANPPAVTPPPATEPTNPPTIPNNPEPTPTNAPDPSNTTVEPVNPNLNNGETGNSGQVGDVTIDTGDATSTTTLITDGNNNTSVTPGGTGGSVTVNNGGNGGGSQNTGSVNIVSDNISVQNNTADINNNLSQGSVSGQNTANDNTGGNTTINTGNANVSGTIMTSVNTNLDGVAVAEFNVADNHVGNLVLDFAANCIANCGLFGAQVDNTGNGANSTNNGSISGTTNNVNFQNNDATLGNTMTLAADSGNNSASRNTNGDNTIITGDANVSANVMNFANNNFAGDVVYGVVNVFGSLVGDIIFPEEAMATLANTGNGADSTNTTNLTTTTNNLSEQTNTANINNTITADATTGENDLSGNTGGDNSLETGDTSVKANVLNVANTNILGDMWIVLVNQAGQWIGKIMGANSGATYAGSEGLEFMVNPNGEIAVTNSGNGSGSTNTGTVDQTTNNTTVQTNTANIDNNLNLSANTGNNAASDNTAGDNKIKTGDANIMANIVNFVNNNVAHSGKLFITVVNVFGSWMGNFVGPGQQPEADPNLLSAEIAPTPGSETLKAGRGGATLPPDPEVTPTPEEDATETLSTTPQPRKTYYTYRPRVAGVQVQGINLEKGEETKPEVQGSQLANAEVWANPGQVKKNININLAWLVLLAPPTILFFLLRRRMIRA